MKSLRRALLSVLPLAMSVAFIQGCGSTLSRPLTRQLLSVTISPPAADAKNYPSGEVPFIATGFYNMSPYAVTPLKATWGASAYPQKIGSVTQNGLATCLHGASGTTTIEAWVQLNPPLCDSIDAAGRPGCGNVGASAQFTCP
ncbi:MAG: hypothetical protein ACYDC6_07075 [Acidobacteriaceae bacterium]